MNSTDKPTKRNTGSIIVKCVVILVVLGVICSLSIWSWFTQNKTALADGIFVKSKGDGVQVSWDGVNYYDNLQALKQEDVSGDANGLALNISGKDGEPAPLSLVTGNGLQFFEPSLNRRLGTVLTNSDGSWHGSDITSANSQGRYIDIDLYFRSESPRDVFLAGDSRISPKSETDRISEYGVFSKDNIASATRLAFLNDEKNDCAFIWAPNADNELEQNDAGYKKYTTTDTTIINGGSSSGVDGGVDSDDGSTYYLWTIAPTADYSNGQRIVSACYEFVYDANVKYYVATFDVIVPSYQADNPSIPFLISQSDSSPIVNTVEIDRSACFSKSQTNNDNGSLLMISNQGYNSATYNNSSISENLCSQFYMTKTNTLIQGTTVTVKFGFNPSSDFVEVLGYHGNDSWGYNGTTTDNPVTVKYYPLENNVNCALVNPLSASAVSKGNNFNKGVSFIDSAKNNVSPVSITLEEQFTTVKDGTGYEATYKFKSNSNNTYLTLTNGVVSYTAAGSSFTLEYKDGVEGPLLKSGDYYLVIDQGKVKGVKADALNTATAVTVYTGTTYKFNTGLTEDKQYYQFYNNTTKQLETLSSATSPKLFTSTNSDTEETKVGLTKITTLEKSAGSDYYTSHIVMRVWVEGTDREAKTPLADGIFDISLHFTSQ